MTTVADILVIGGGIAGISAAGRLSPDAHVIVLERETAIGTHSSGRSAAVYIRNYGNATLRALTGPSAAVFESNELSDTPLLSPRGEMGIVGEADLPQLESHISESVGVERLTPAEAVALCPILREDLIAGAALEENARDIDVDALLQGFVRLLRSNAGQIIPNAEVTSLRREGTWRIETTAGAFEAPIVVNASGAWADQIAGLAGVGKVGLVPMRRSAAILPAPEGEDIGEWPVVGPLDESWYCKPQSGKLLVSPADEDPVEPHDAWPDDMVLAAGLDRFEQATTYAVTRVERSWAGLRSFVADRTPVAGFAPDAEGFFWLAGQGGYGIQTSPALSQLVADLIMGRDPAVDEKTIAALSPGRSGIGPGAAVG